MVANHRLRLFTAWLALSTLAALPQAATGAKTTLSLDVPSNVSAGVLSAVTVNLPAAVAAVDGRVLVGSGSVELIGVAPLGAGTALSPVVVQNGYGFGAYGLAARNGRASLRLVLLPKVSGKLDIRVLIDALGDSGGLRLTPVRNELAGTFHVNGGSRHVVAPGGRARGAPARAARGLRPVFGRPVLSVDDLDAVRAAWYRTRELGTSCAPASDTAADANDDGCVDVVDLQAVAAAQGTQLVASGSARDLAPDRVSQATASAAADTTPARVFTVNSTADTPDASPGNALCADAQGACTLRAAMTEANWQTGLTRIAFNLPGTAPVTIQLGSAALPNVGTATASVFIDGYSQPGSKANDAAHGTNAQPGVEVRGAGNNTSRTIFYVSRAGNTIRGLLLDNAYRGIFFDGPAAANNVVAGNWMGFARDNSLPARGFVGVLLNNGAHDNVVGTSALADRNVIGNWDKAVLSNGAGSDANVIQNNVLCIAPNGAGATCQTAVDFDFGPKDALVGGAGTNEGNVVGPTCCNAVELSHGWDPSGKDGYTSKWQISGIRVIGNWLGFRVDGSYDPAYRSAQSVPTYDNGQAVNLYDGVVDDVIQGNYIASVYDGITISSSTSTRMTVQNNFIGRSPLGQPAPLSGWGVNLRWDTQVHSIVGNQISNAATGGFGLNGLQVKQVTLTRNLVFGTSGPAIYFAADANNPTTGANDQLRGPSVTATTTYVSGTGVAGATVEVYRASGAAGAQGLPIAYLGSASVDANGRWSLSRTLATGDIVTALQTRLDGTTSLLSPNVAAGSAISSPVAGFTWQQVNGTLTVNFSDTSTGQPTAWLWSFGDGTSSTQQSPSKAYAAGGDYTVTLTASNGGGSSSKTQAIHVDPLPADPPYADDTFGRSIASGWGKAESGGVYTLLGTAANYSVTGGAGLMVVPKAANTRQATLAAASASDVDLLVRFAVDKLPVGGAQYVYLVARSQANSSYRPKVILFANGTVQVHAGILLSGSESSLGPAVTVSGLTPVVGSYIWLRAQVTGTNPTTIRVKAWRDGEAEPSAWQFTATNSAAALQTSGGVGLAASLGSTTGNAPVTFRFDDFSVTEP